MDSRFFTLLTTTVKQAFEKTINLDALYYFVNPFTAKDAIWRPQVITHTAIGLTFANKYFYVSQHSMRLF